MMTSAPLHKDVAEGARGRGGKSFCFVVKVVLGHFYVCSRIYTGWDALSALSCFLVAVDNNSNDKPMGWGQKNTHKKQALLWRHQHWPRAFKLGCLPLCSSALGSFVLPSNSSQFVMPLFLATGQASFLCTNSFSSPFYPPISSPVWKCLQIEYQIFLVSNFKVALRIPSCSWSLLFGFQFLLGLCC